MNVMSKRFDANDEKFEILSNDIKEQKIKCEQQNIKNDIIFKEIKEQNIHCLLYTSRCV